ncbi:hypothetical protein F5Y08DRAFT_126633 [Xylaria arbuscula]|nr:hypothetical protein F5Y08DRAFT_126633 [Xylaria arbuscula]
MPEYEYIRRTPSPRFIRSHSFSYQTRPRFCRLRCPENCACVSLDDWNELSQRERSAREKVEKLRGAHAENRRLKQQLEELSSSHRLRDTEEGVKARRRMTALRADLENKNVELHDLRRDKEVADIRVREISQTLTDKNMEIDDLTEKNRQLARANRGYKHDLEARAKEARNAWDIVGELRRQLRGFQHPFSFRSYGYA